MVKTHKISDYRILGYLEEDKQELIDRDMAIKEINGQSIKICAQSPLDKWFDKQIKRSPFDTGDKGLKR